MYDFDEYKVDVSLSFTTRGHHDWKFPDKEWNLSFDATDVNLDVVLEQFTLMLSAMDYVVDGKHLELVDSSTSKPDGAW